MNIYIIILIVISVIALSLIIYYSNYNKLKEYKEKMDKAEEIIDVNLAKKLDLIIAINPLVKKLTEKKDYLKDYISLDNEIITNIEKDWKLNEAEKLINDLSHDYTELLKDDKFKSLLNDIRKTNEHLIASKNIFNENALLSNNLIKAFPGSVIARLKNFKIKTYYTNKKNNDNESF